MLSGSKNIFYLCSQGFVGCGAIVSVRYPSVPVDNYRRAQGDYFEPAHHALVAIGRERNTVGARPFAFPVGDPIVQRAPRIDVDCHDLYALGPVFLLYLAQGRSLQPACRSTGEREIEDYYVPRMVDGRK